VERKTIAGETEVLEENLPQRHFVPPKIPHDQVRFRTPDRSGGKPVTNRLSYGAAYEYVAYLTDKKYMQRFAGETFLKHSEFVLRNNQSVRILCNTM
jgi:hypothetical protein